jgi:hypothetical protein
MKVQGYRGDGGKDPEGRKRVQIGMRKKDMWTAQRVTYLGHGI